MVQCLKIHPILKNVFAFNTLRTSVEKMYYRMMYYSCNKT